MAQSMRTVPRTANNPLLRDEPKANDIGWDEAPGSPCKEKEANFRCTDPDSDYIELDDKPAGFFHLNHRAGAAHHSIITDTLNNIGP
jgi:hypothetical protein